MHAPMPLDANADIIVDDLPTGSLIVFLWTAFISYFFSFVGFALTYLLHTTHAAKFGSRAGLGITLIQYGFFTRMQESTGPPPDVVGGGGDGTDAGSTAGEMIFWNTTSGMSVVVDKTDVDALLASSNGTLIEWGEVNQYSITSRDWLSLLFMTLGTCSFLPTTRVFSHLDDLSCMDRNRLVPSPLLHRQLLSRQTMGIFHSPLVTDLLRTRIRANTDGTESMV